MSPDLREKIAFDDPGATQTLLGTSNGNLKLVERETGASLHVRGSEVTILGDMDAAGLARTLLEQLYAFAKRGAPLAAEDIVRAARILRGDRTAQLREIFSDTVLVSGRARPITPKGLAQKRYVDSIREHDIVFGIGPAGTGKTYLAMALAVRALMDKTLKRIILARPAVEAGEKLGFLPGSMEEKVNPYLRPLYDALHDMMEFERAQQLLEKGIIEVAPLAFMRGRTLNDSFVILDEAQNTTSEQMKMFLTRLGYNSKAVITGDVTQIDLPVGQRSGLSEAREILSGIDGIRFCYFTEIDVVRHPLVQQIIKAYEKKGGAHHKASPVGIEADMPRVSHVTSSGFVFERQEQVVVVRTPRALVPLAELEFLREVEAPGGRIADVRRTTGDGRELHLVTVEVPGVGSRVVSFDAGPALLGHFRRLTDGLQLLVYGLAGATAIGTLGYMLIRWISAS